MSEKQVVVKIDYDVNEAVANLDALSKTIAENKTQQKELSAAYKTGEKSLADYIKESSILKEQEGKANAEKKNTIKILQSEEGSLNSLRAEIGRLTKERNALNLNTKEGQERLAELNKQINTHNDVIKENVDQLTKQKINIGNYGNAFDGLKDNISSVSPALGGLIESTSKFLPVIKGVGSSITSLVPSFKGVKEESKGLADGFIEVEATTVQASSGFKGMAKAALSFMLSPIGIFIGLLAASFLLVKNAMDRNQETLHKLTKAFAPLKGAVNAILGALEPLGEFIIDHLIVSFDVLGKTAMAVMNGIAKGLSALGFDNAGKSIDSFNKKIKEGAALATQLADAEAKLEKSQRLSQKVQLDYQKTAEGFRQIRDNENKTIQERIKANDDLGATLKKQLNEELKIAKLALETANLRLKLEGQTAEHLDAQAEALTKISDIQERVSGQESEQIANAVSLRKEANEKRIAGMEAELNLFKEKNRFEAENIEFLKTLAAEETKVLKAKLAANLISQTEYKTETLRLANDILAREKEISAENIKLFEDELKAKADAEAKEDEIDQKYRDDLKKRNEAAISELAAIKQMELEREAQSIDELFALRREAEVAEFEALKANKELTKEELDLIDEEHRIKMLEIEAEHQQAIRDERQKTIDMTLAGLDLILNAANQYAGKRVLIANDTFSKLAAINFKEIKNAKDGIAQIGQAASGLTALITSNHQDELASFDAMANAQINKAGQSTEEKEKLEKYFAKVKAGIMTKQAKEEKLKAILDIGLSTAVAVAAAMAATPLPPFPGAIAAGILGAIQLGIAVAKPIPTFNAGSFAEGGMIPIGGKPHSLGGTKFVGSDGTSFEAERGEGLFILKRDAASHINALSSINQSFGGNPMGAKSKYLADGGSVSQAPDVEELKRAITEGMSSVRIVTQVADIKTGLTDYDNVKNNAVL